MTSQFRNSMMLYRPSLSVWTARKKDKEQSEKTNKDAGAVAGAANVYKALLPDSKELMNVQRWATGFRAWVYQTTLPWDDNGGRVARVEKHMEFMQMAGDKMREGDALVDEFMNMYASSIEVAKFKLNGMFNADDYPTVETVRRKFFFTIECEAVPEAADFRIIDGLPPEEVERLVHDASSGIERRIGAAMAELQDRLMDVVVKFRDTLMAFGNKEIKKFNDTLQTNITDLTSIVPSLNLTNDPQLAALGIEAGKLGAYDLKDLRKDEAVRNGAIAEAGLLIAKFTGNTDDQAKAYAQVTAHLGGISNKAQVNGADADVIGPDDEPFAPVPETKPAIDPASLTEGW